MSNKKNADSFFDSIDHASIVNNIQGIYTSDGSMSTLLDFERVLDESDLYAFKNWELGELVDGPVIKRYSVACIFMYPRSLMPDPRAAKRLLSVGCSVQFKKTTIKVAREIEQEDDFQPGTNYPKMVKRAVWLVRIVVPRELMNDVREGSIEIADQTINLDELDEAYDKDLDDSDENAESDATEAGGMDDMGMGDPNDMNMGGPQL